MATLQAWVGVAGFLISLINAAQIWRKNRPVWWLGPGGHTTQALSIKVQNPGSRPITIIRSKCLPSRPHRVWVPGREIREQVSSSVYNEINKIIPSGSTEECSFVAELEGRFWLLIYWQSNSAFIFSRFPLVIRINQGLVSRLARAD